MKRISSDSSGVGRVRVGKRGNRAKAEWSRRHLPVSDLFQVVQRVPQGASGHSDQLPVDWQRRRHPPGAGRHGGLRRQRRPDDRRADCRSRRSRSCTFPTVLGAVVPTYNVPGVSGELKFTPDVLADIFLGKITKLERRRASRRTNPGVNLPDQRHHRRPPLRRQRHHLHLHRLPLQGQPGLEERPGQGHLGEAGRVGLGGKGNEGVAGMVRQTPGSIGYVELIYALQNKIAYGTVKNASGSVRQGSHRSLTAAAAVSEDHAGRLPRLDHQRSRQGRLSHLQLHLAADPQADPDRGKGKDDQGLPDLDARSRIRGDQASTMRRFLKP